MSGEIGRGNKVQGQGKVKAKPRKETLVATGDAETTK
jgi:hypothetical protein